MQTFLLSVAMALLICVAPGSAAAADEEGFSTIFDKNHTDGWRYIGDGEMVVRDGVASTSSRKGARFGLYWYRKKAFADFTLRLEFNIDTGTSNSGILVRFPDPGNDYEAADGKAYEIDIYGEKTGTIVSHSDRVRPTKIVPLHPGDWNECEVTAIGQKYVVKLNGQVVNEYIGRRALSGYLGLQYWKGDGDVHFRNVRIKELPTTPGLESGIASDAPAKAAPSFLEILSEQAPNALEWALAPLDRTTPPDIRQNLMALRENLLDEAANKPSAGADAYKLGQQLCNNLIATLNERDKALVRAGYTAAQASANIAVTNQSLEARRNSQMRWPQYFREKDQRDELRRQKDDGAALAKQRPALEWADRGEQIRKSVDALYAQFRAAARRSPAPK
jgi:hypothetical protein